MTAPVHREFRDELELAERDERDNPPCGPGAQRMGDWPDPEGSESRPRIVAPPAVGGGGAESQQPGSPSPAGLPEQTRDPKPARPSRHRGVGAEAHADAGAPSEEPPDFWTRLASARAEIEQAREEIPGIHHDADMRVQLSLARALEAITSAVRDVRREMGLL